MDLKNKTILFSTAEDEYREAFKSEMNRIFKASVYTEALLPFSEKKYFFIKFFREIHRIFPRNSYLEKLYDFFASFEYKKIINSYSETFDYFLVVSSGKFSNGYIKELKKKNPNVKTILFLWDKLEYTNWQPFVNSFDYIFSFDKNDCNEYGFFFRPTFYTRLNTNNSISFQERIYDLYYVGSLRDISRYELSNKLYNHLMGEKLNPFIKLFAHKEREFSILPQNYNEKLITTEKINFYDDLENTKNTKVILDLTYGEQIGLTLRCFNALATNTKILTNNSDIANYDFYNENNIQIISSIEDIKNIPISFFVEPFVEIDKRIVEKYSMQGFILDIINTIEQQTNDKSR